MCDENRSHSPPPSHKSRMGSSRARKREEHSSPHHFQPTDPGISPIFPSSSRRMSDVEKNNASLYPMNKSVPRSTKGHPKEKSFVTRNPLPDLSPIHPTSNRKKNASMEQTDKSWKKDHKHFERTSPAETGGDPSTQPRSSDRFHFNPAGEYQHKVSSSSSVPRQSSSDYIGERMSSAKGLVGEKNRQDSMRGHSSKKHRDDESRMFGKNMDVEPKPGMHSFDDSEKLPFLPPIKPVVTPSGGCERVDLLGRHQKHSPARFKAKPSDRSPMSKDERRLMSALIGKEKDLDNLSHLGRFVPIDPLTSQGSPNTRSTLPTKFGDGITPCLKTAQRTEPTSISARTPGDDTLMFQGIRPPEFGHRSLSSEKVSRSKLSKQVEFSDEQSAGFVDQYGERQESKPTSAVESTSHTSHPSKTRHSTIHEQETFPANKSLPESSELTRVSGRESDSTKITQGSAVEKESSVRKPAEFSWEGRHTPFVYDFKRGKKKESTFQNTRSQRFDQSGDRHSRNVSSPLYPFDSQEIASKSRSSPLYKFNSKEDRSDSLPTTSYNFESADYAKKDSQEFASKSRSSPLYKFNSKEDRSDSLPTTSYNFESADYAKKDSQEFASKSRSSPLYKFDSKVDRSDGLSTPIYKFESADYAKKDSQEFASKSRSSPLYKFDSKVDRSDSLSTPIYKFESADYATKEYSTNYYGNDPYQSTQQQDHIPQSLCPGTSSYSSLSPGYRKDKVFSMKSPLERFYREVLKNTPSFVPQLQSQQESTEVHRPQAKTHSVEVQKPMFVLDLSDAEIHQVIELPTYKTDRLFSLYIEEAICRRRLGKTGREKSPTPLIKSLDDYWCKYLSDCRLANKIFESSRRALVYFKEREVYWENIRRTHGAPVDWIVRHYFLCRKKIDDEPTMVSDACFLKNLPLAQYRAAELDYLKFIYIMQH